MAAKATVARRREAVKQLHARALNENEILESLHAMGFDCKRATLYSDIAWIKENQVSWWKKNADPEGRAANYFAETLAEYDEVMKQLWVNHDKAAEKNDLKNEREALLALGVLVKYKAELLGFTGTRLQVYIDHRQMEQMAEHLSRLEDESNNFPGRITNQLGAATQRKQGPVKDDGSSDGDTQSRETPKTD